jgi:hypothetical protein
VRSQDHVHAFRIRQLLSGVKVSIPPTILAACAQLNHKRVLVQTVYGTQLSDAEVDELFSDFDIKEHEVVDYKQFVLALTSGFSRIEWEEPE